MVSVAISTQIFAVNLSAPLMGWLATRYSLRKLMFIAAAAQGTAFLGMGLATHYDQILVCYALNGLGYCMFGAVGPYTLVSRWFEADRAKAMGFMTIPIVLTLAPLAAAPLAIAFGSRGVFFAVSAIYYLCLPLILFIVDRPEDVGQTAWRGSKSPAPEAGTTPAGISRAMTYRELLASWKFWLLTLGYALMTGPAYVFATHAVPYAMQRGGVTLEAAAVLLAAFGATGLVGTVLCGFFADKIGARRGLIVIALGLALGQAWLLLSSTLTSMIIGACILGTLATAIAAVHTSAVNEIFGKESVPTVTGLTFFVRLPILVGFPTFAGYLFDITGSYRLAFTILVVCYLVAAAGFAVIAKVHGRASAPAPAATV
jgi:MFS family permease